MKLRNKLSIAGCVVILAGTIIIGNQKYQDRQDAVVEKSAKELNERELTVASKNDSTSEDKESSVDTDSATVDAKGNDVDSNTTESTKKADSSNTETAQDTSSSTASTNSSQTKDVQNTSSSSAAATPKKVDSSVSSPAKDKPSSSIPVKKDESTGTTPPKDKDNTSDLHFSSREEAIQYGTSRLSAEELVIYNKASAKGLTNEQEALAFQIASSRFTSEEMQALKEALNK